MITLLLLLLKWFLLAVDAIMIICIVLVLAVVWIGRMESDAMEEHEKQKARKNNR